MRGDERRRGILRFVRDEPGATILEVAEAVRVTHPTAAYHLSGLERDGAVESERYGNKRHFFIAGVHDAWARRALVLMLSDENARVLNAVWTSGLTYRGEIAEQEGVTPLTVSASARRLHQVRLVETTREGRTRRLTANRAFAEPRCRALVRKLPPGSRAHACVTQLLRGPPATPAVASPQAEAVAVQSSST